MLSVPHDEGRAAFLDALDGFVGAVRPLDDRALLAASRCWGWCVVDVVTHVRLGLEEVASCLLTAGTDLQAPDRDAATYWETQPAGGDELAGILALRRVASATHAPTGALPPLRTVADALTTRVASLEDGALGFQGWVLTTGDLLATWAVELAVHQLDLGRDLEVARPPARALAVGRRTVEALLGCPVPVEDDEDALLLATGRRAPTLGERDRLGPYAERLPAL
ncbi:maleylpyruvate isomerase N-terminal domain-containing protein [Microlunatus spumicola]|uniref:Maleylpyruvate isomerase N-terminal domain-containing protein n=1 Tax=Microlunatus spumicola TaxID=81499 RepID=A0ABP6XP15_9ACTN